MNARKPPVHRTGAGLRHAIRVWVWLYTNGRGTAPHIAAATGIDARQVRRTLCSLGAAGCAARDEHGRWSSRGGGIARNAALDALADGPLTTTEIVERTGASSKRVQKALEVAERDRLVVLVEAGAGKRPSLWRLA